MGWWMAIVWAFSIIGALFALAVLVAVVLAMADYVRGISDNKARICEESHQRGALEKRVSRLEQGLCDAVTYDDVRRLLNTMEAPDD